MQPYDELIDELSKIYEIIPEYWDISGKSHETSLETKKAILRSMKLKIGSAKELTKEINEYKWKSWKNFIEPVYIVSVNSLPFTIPLYIPIKDGDERRLSISLSIKNEQGREHKSIFEGDAIIISEVQWIDKKRYIKINLQDIVQQDIGYYEINVECKHIENIFPGNRNKLQKKSRLIIAPDACYIPPELEKERIWGLSVNLYSIRSNRNWGIGDFGDLKKIARWIYDLKGGFVGINPLHVIPNTKPFGISPYFPLSRLYKNFIYLDIEKIPDVMESEDVMAIITSDENFKKELDELKNAGLIDYEKIASLKENILRKAFDIFHRRHYILNSPRSIAFKKFISENKTSLESFSLFMAIWNYMATTKNIYRWQEWPAEYHSQKSKAVRAFKKTNEKEIVFYQYVQWLIDEQLKEVFIETKNLNMPLGLYFDLAIGSVGGGSDVWNYKDVIADDADVGAPPDDFSPNGQNWGFPPLIPEKLKDSGYEFFIQTIRKNMKYGGALRIDHALGMFRLFWIPEGISSKDGAYVKYPEDALLHIIALESVRNKTMVIAEDLGTMGENVREMLKKFNMLSYRLFYFERNYPDPSFVTPEKYPEMALCAITTHDLPTIYGYWAGHDFEVKKQLGIYKDEKLLQEQINERKRDKELILSALKSLKIILDNHSPKSENFMQMTPELCLAIYHYLALTPCKLLLISLDDIIGTVNQQNMPGTIAEYPNWLQKTPLTLEDMLCDKRFTELSEMLKQIMKAI
ncbi:MAG: 4-alpha-glucanotransferase [Nitrospirota bacterium]